MNSDECRGIVTRAMNTAAGICEDRSQLLRGRDQKEFARVAKACAIAIRRRTRQIVDAEQALAERRSLR